MSPSFTFGELAMTLVFFAVGIAISAIIFLLIRRLVLWYFRLDQIADDLSFLATYYRQQERNDTRPARQPLPPLSPRENLTLEERARRLQGGQSTTP